MKLLHFFIFAITRRYWLLFLFTLLNMSWKTAQAQSGTSMYDPIIITINSCSGTNFSDYQNNAYGGFYDNFGNPNPDVWYTFTVTDYTDVAISLCGSNFDTYLYVLDAGGGVYASNDDYGALCGGSNASIYITFSPGTYYIVAEGSGYNTGDLAIDVSVGVSGTPSVGANMTYAINAGSFSGSGSYTDTRSNADGCLGNDLGQPSNDIYYQFTLTGTSEVTLSHCGSGFDTYLHLLDASGNLVAYNDDNSGPTCPGTQSYLQMTLSPGTYYVVSEGYGSNVGNIVTNINIVPSSVGSAPVIAYNSPSLIMGAAINPLSPTNTGGAVSSVGQSTTTFAGSGVAGFSNGSALSATFSNPLNAVVDGAGNVYISDVGNHSIRKITPAGMVSTFAGAGSSGYADGIGTSAYFRHPSFMAIDAYGTMFVSDQQNHRIRKISPSGVVTTFVGSGSIGSANGAGTSASFQYPMGLAFDASGNLYVADAYNHKIRKITPLGVVSDFAGSGSLGSTNGPALSASFNRPMGLAFDASGNLYVADRDNAMIRKITPAGEVSTLAGSLPRGFVNGPGATAKFDPTNNLVLDAAGNIYVADQGGNMIRKVTPSGEVSTLAGTTTAGYVDGTGSAVRLSSPYGIARGGDGAIYVIENASNRIRKMVLLDAYSISPALPAGLVFDGSTGVISGTPTAVSPWITYTVTASNNYGTGSAMFNLRVVFEPYANVNFIHSKSYDDDGVLIDQRKTFYNNDGRPIQSQVKNLSANQVLASEVLYDAFGRSAGFTLAAPINNSELNYKENFVTNGIGLKYDYRSFDLGKTNNPDPINNSSPGTLGWYYSDNNNMEPYVPATAYPYSRSTFFNDGTGGYKKHAGIGEVLKMGSGYQSSTNALGVVNELDFYTQLRNKFFHESTIGSGNSLKGNGMLQVVQDENGIQGASVTNLEGKVLMTAKAGAVSGLVVNNSVEIANQTGYQYFIDWSDGGFSPLFTPYIYVNGGNIEIFRSMDNWVSSTSEYSGPAIDYYSFAALAGKYKITSSTPFRISYQVPTNNGTQISACQNCDGYLTSEGKDQMHYFRLYANTTISVTGTGWKLYNMSENEQEISTSGSSITLNRGYYKVSIPESGNAIIAYSNTYSDISYNFYNQLGQLVGSIAPEGVKALLTNGLSSYAAFSNVPFISTYEYDTRGRAVANTQTDAGRTEFIYRKDGSVRFSQNSLQRSASPKRFSYTNYDRWGRSIESGEFVEAATITFTGAKTNTALQESLATDGGLSGESKSDWVRIHYDDVDNSHGVSGYVQNENSLRTSVNWTENASGSKTWYNYDDEGRMLWTIRYIPGLGYKTVDYAYDAKGNASKVDYQKNTAAEQFVHEYEYDADNRLLKTYTLTASSGRKQQAHYYYYLYGPLKRVELANNLQGLDYAYTAQGMLKSINHPVTVNDPGKDGVVNGISPDVFGMTLEYFDGDYTRTGTGINSLGVGGTPSYNGSIMGQSWRSQKPASLAALYGSSVNDPAMVTYAYDNNYQFDNNKFGTPNFGSNSFTEMLNANREYGLSYDANGNINSLNRTNSSGTNIANFVYSYHPNTNKLTSVSNYASYAYDELGQMNSQVRNGVGYYLSYNVRGKVTAIYSDAGKTLLRVSFGYDESGNRIRKTDHILNTITYYVYDTSGNLLSVYDDKGSLMQQKELPVYAGSRVGVYHKLSNNYLYELTDHLGNVRVVINETKLGDGQADVVHYSDYYPYGSPLTLAANDYRYGYQGQYAEVDKETGWNNFDLRMYDATIGRWMSTDPARQYHSPYAGMGNDPVSSVDPDGGYSFWKGLGAWIAGGFSGHFGRDANGDRKGEWFISSSVEGKSGDYGVSIRKDYGDPPSKIQKFLDAHTYMQNYIKAGGTLDNFGRPKATGRAEPNYFFEEMVIGGIAARGVGIAYEGLTSRAIYRVVSNNEALDVLEYGFRQAPISTKIASYEGKLFWTNIDDAKWYQNWVGEGNQILKIKVNKSFIFENGTDVGRPFYFVSPERLSDFNSAIRSIK